MGMFSKEELIADYRDIADNGYESSVKKRLAEKYGTTKRINDIKQEIFNQLNIVRSNSSDFTKDDVIFFEKEDGKLKDKLTKESIPFITFYKNYLYDLMKSKHLLDKIDLYNKRDWNYSITGSQKYLIEKYVTVSKYLESLSDEHKEKVNIINEIFNKLVSSTKDFYKFYINKSKEKAASTYESATKNIKHVESELKTMKAAYDRNSAQDQKFYSKYKELTSKLVKLQYILSVTKDEFVDKAKKEADDDYNQGIKVVASKLEAKSVTPDKMEIVYTNVDPKFFEMIIKYGNKSFHARSIIAAEYSEKVQTHLRFIITEKSR